MRNIIRIQDRNETGLRNEKRAEAERTINELRRRDCCENLAYSVAKVRLTVLQDKITDEDGQAFITVEELDELEKACAQQWVEYYSCLLETGCSVYEPEYMLQKMMEYYSLAGKKLSRTEIKQAVRYASRKVALVKAQDRLDDLLRHRREFPPNVHAKVDDLLIKAQTALLSPESGGSQESHQALGAGAQQ